MRAGLAGIEMRLSVLTWMVGTLVAVVVAIGGSSLWLLLVAGAP